MAHKRILIVDDEKNILSSLKRLLESDYTVFIAQGGTEALELIAKESGQFDLILCDLSMPDVNGANLYIALGDKYIHLQERVIFMTGGPFGGYLEDFGLTDKNPCLNKPLDPDKIVHTIENFFNSNC